MQGHELVSGIPDADLAVCGPLARRAEDLHVALDIMAGPAPREATAWRLELPSPEFDTLKNLRVAVWHSDDMAPVASEISNRVQVVADRLGEIGAVVSDRARPDIDLARAHANYQTLLSAVMTAAMQPEQVAAANTLAQQFAADDMSNDAVSARAAVISHREWIRTNTQREKLRRAWSAFFNDWDILICPQMATTAFPHDHSPLRERTLAVDNSTQPYFQQLFWAGLIVNAYLPSTVFPTGLSADGLPIGLQAVAAPYRDHNAIEFARLLTREVGGFTPPPGL